MLEGDPKDQGRVTILHNESASRCLISCPCYYLPHVNYTGSALGYSMLVWELVEVDQACKAKGMLAKGRKRFRAPLLGSNQARRGRLPLCYVGDPCPRIQKP